MTRTNNGHRVPPNLLASEEALLGAAMQGPAGLEALLNLPESDLYRPAHRTVYAAIKSLATTGAHVTPAAVVSALTRAGTLGDIGGAPFIFGLYESADVAPAGRWHARQIQEVARLRLLADVGVQLQVAALDRPADPDKLTAMAVERLLNTSGRSLDDLMVTPDDAREFMVDRAELERAGATVSWTLPELDEVVKLLPGTLTYVAARPKVGKSSLVFQVAARASEHTRTLVASYEMGRDQFHQHVMAEVGNVTLAHAKYGPYDDPHWLVADDAARVLDLVSIYHQPDIATLAAQVTAAHRVRPFGLVVVDYIGKVAQATAIQRGQLGEFQMVVAHVSGRLKALAMELEVPILATAQINRAGADEPDLIHLRDSGALEADADAVVLLHRPDPDNPFVVEYKVAANRMGPPTPWRPLRFEGARGRFRPAGLAVVGTG